MTLLNCVEIDNILYKTNDIKYAIKNNEPIEDKLNVIIVVSNPCLYKRRYKLFNEFIKRFEDEETYVNLFIVEMIYKDQKFIVTDKNNKKHLQLKTDTPIWHKENMINLGVKYLLPADYKAFAWIDADLEFESNTWALDTLKILNGCKDVVQLFSHAVDMNHDETSLNCFNSLGYSFAKEKPYITSGLDYWHPGFAWAITRKAYEKMGGIYDKGVLGAGDAIMALAFVGKVNKMSNPKYHTDYNNSMKEFQERSRGLRLGYVPCVIRHHYHGTKQNRKYVERSKIIITHLFSPLLHLTYDEKGILIPTKDFCEEFKKDIMNYFTERKEDD